MNLAVLSKLSFMEAVSLLAFSVSAFLSCSTLLENKMFTTMNIIAAKETATKTNVANIILPDVDIRRFFTLIRTVSFNFLHSVRLIVKGEVT